MTDPKKLKVTFAPGCFDNFEGTQEELNAFIKEIEEMIETGELMEESTELSEEDWDELPDDVKLKIMESLETYNDDDEQRRKLH